MQRGEYLGKPPFGYIKSTDNKYRLMVDPKASAVVKKVYDMYTRGYGYKRVAEALNGQAIMPPKGVMWRPTTIKRILCNRVYTGVTVQGIYERVSYKNRKVRRMPEESWFITPSTHEMIIDMELFEAVQDMIRSKGHIRLDDNAGGEHVACEGRGARSSLGDFLFCGGCGAKMYARKRNGSRYDGYICSNYARYGKIACDSHFIRSEHLAGELKRAVVDVLRENEQFQNTMRNLWDNEPDIGWNSQRTGGLCNELSGKLRSDSIGRLNNGRIGGLSDGYRRRIQQEIEILRKKRDLLFEEKFKGSISDDYFAEKYMSVELAITRLEKDAEQIHVAALDETGAYTGERHEGIDVEQVCGYVGFESCLSDARLMADKWIESVCMGKIHDAEKLRCLLKKITVNNDGNADIEFNLTEEDRYHRTGN
jgi:hypothetical protein